MDALPAGVMFAGIVSVPGGANYLLARRIRPGDYAGQVLTRIDLRGETAASLGGQRLAGGLPRARLDVAAALEAGRPGCQDGRVRGAPAGPDPTPPFGGGPRCPTPGPPAA